MLSRKSGYLVLCLGILCIFFSVALVPVLQAGPLTFTVDDWGTGHTGRVRLENYIGEQLSSWTIEFDYPFTITNIWNARITDHTGDRYTFANMDYNGSVAPDGVISFGFNATPGNVTSDPANLTLNGVPMDDPGQDPVLHDDTGSVPTGSSVVIDVLGNDTDLPPDPVVSIATQGQKGTATVLADMRVRYTPDQDATGVDTFSYTVDGVSDQAAQVTVTITQQVELNKYTQRFNLLWTDIHRDENGYFSPDGAPYHTVETLIVEAPNHGHETTSEAYSYWIWLEAMYGRLSGDWSYLQHAWDKLEAQIIPSHQDQPANSGYNPAAPAVYAGEFPLPNDYPAPLDRSVPVGRDPVSEELHTTYSTWDIYGMHWLLDCDNFYGYGRHGDRNATPAFINTFQRGEQESCWETVPHPSWEDFSFGRNDSTGFLSLFIGDSSYARQWRYTVATDADARVVQAMYWADTWASAQGVDLGSLVSRAAMMGDYLRLAMFDKYFKPIGCQDLHAPGGTGYDSAHYLLSWYYAWGGPTDSTSWAFRIGCSHVHFGYQNPLAAWVLSQNAKFRPRSANGARDWGLSLQRQLEFYRWLQSSEGAIAGGATNSWNGRYDPYPDGKSTFYGMAYDEHPVYHDPGSNSWFGMQAWSMERVAEFYYATGNALAKEVLDRWIAWIKGVVRLNEDGTYQIPARLGWSGEPDPWNPAAPGVNSGLHVTVEEYNQDIGITASLARTLTFYAAGTERYATLDEAAKLLARELLDRMWSYRDDRGLSVPEQRPDYLRFFEQEVYVPTGWQGAMANGDRIEPGVRFLDIRSAYRDDPMFPALEAAYQAYQNGTTDEFVSPAFRYHRFWAQAEAALAYGEYGFFFGAGEPPENSPPVAGDDTAETMAGRAVTIDVLANDSDADGDPLSLTAVDEPTHGATAISGSSVIYTPEAGYSGTDSFSYTISDGRATATGSVTVTVSVPPEARFNYAEALQKALYFYDAQRAGILPKHDGDMATAFHRGFLKNRVPWRGDAYVEDGKYGHDGVLLNLDLNGGWFDAGDHVKFGLPMAASASYLGWGILEFWEGYQQTGQLPYALDNLRWVADYFMKAHTAPHELYAQVGNGEIDHSVWAPPEVQSLKYKEVHGARYRPAIKLTMDNPGADLVAQTSAALTIASLVFRRNGEIQYADELLRHARELFEFAELTRDVNEGRYTPSMEFDGYNYAMAYYNSSSGAKDEYPWAAAWLYLATKEPAYLHKAEDAYTAIADNTGHFAWYPSWEDCRNAVYYLMERIALEPEYPGDTQVDPARRAQGFNDYEAHCTNYVNELLHNKEYTPGGMIYLDGFASGRAAGMAAFVALVHRAYLHETGKDAALQAELQEFAVNQIDYLLGNNPVHMSYMVGFGENWQLYAHHRSSHGSSRNNINDPAVPRHVLYGALSGGPDRNDNCSLDRSDFPMTEVATDMNAGFTGALAGLSELFAGNPLPVFPPPEPDDEPEVYAMGRRSLASGSSGAVIKVRVLNESYLPPRGYDNLKFRYFMDLADEFANGYTLESIMVQTYYNSRQTGNATLHPWSGTLYYVEGDFSGALINPVGDSDKMGEIEFYVGNYNRSGWDPSNDPSGIGLTETFAITDRIAIYADGQIIWGQEPGVPLPGDVNADTTVDLLDLVSSLRIMTSLAPGSTVSLGGDANGDRRIGLPEAVHVLREVSGSR